MFSCIVVLNNSEKAEPKSEDRQLVWSDEFDINGMPDSTKWDYDFGNGCPKNCGWGNEELQYYTSRAENVRVEDGMLHIEVEKEGFEDHNYTSARLVTRGKGSWQYGRIEVRAKLPYGRGTWPAIWMLPIEKQHGGWPSDGEIDIMEHVGHEPNYVYASVHTKAFNHVDGTQKTAGMMEFENLFEETFHVYAVDWTKERMQFLVDDIPYLTFENANATYKEWPFDAPFYLILNVAVGGTWGGAQGVREDIWPQQLEVDYVRVYQ